MPRKKRLDASTTAQKAQETRWRYLIRNPDFCKDLHRLSRLGGDFGKVLTRREKIADKWELLKIPARAMFYAPWLKDPEEVTFFEPFGADDGVTYSPVAATELKDNRFLSLGLT